jgi:hypothetical protein
MKNEKTRQLTSSPTRQLMNVTIVVKKNKYQILNMKI